MDTQSDIDWWKVSGGLFFIVLFWGVFLISEQRNGFIGYERIPGRLRGMPLCLFYPSLVGFTIYGLYNIMIGLRGK